MNFRRSVDANEFWLKDKSMSGDGYLQALFVRKLHMPMIYACMHESQGHGLDTFRLSKQICVNFRQCQATRGVTPEALEGNFLKITKVTIFPVTI